MSFANQEQDLLMVETDRVVHVVVVVTVGLGTARDSWWWWW